MREIKNQGRHDASRLVLAVALMLGAVFGLQHSPARSGQIYIPGEEENDDAERKRRANCASLYSEKRQLEQQMRRTNSPQYADSLNARMRNVNQRLEQSRCTETGN